MTPVVSVDDADLGSGPGREGDGEAALDGTREAASAGVIGVLAEDLDAAGDPEAAGRLDAGGLQRFARARQCLLGMMAVRG